MKYLIIIPIVIVALIVSLSLYLQPNDFIGCDKKPAGAIGTCAAADAIVVVSGGDTNARTDAGIDLFMNGWAGTLIFSGAAQDKSGPSNAAVMKQRAIDAGIPETAIIIDELSETTGENAAFTKSILKENNVEKVILVTSGYHQRRASLEFKRTVGDEVRILNYPVMNDKDWSAWWWTTPRGWWLSGGEVVKIVISYIQGAV